MTETIFTERVLVVIQKWPGTMARSSPEYHLFDQNWRQLGVARRPAPNAYDPGPLQVMDMTGSLLLTNDVVDKQGRPAILIRDRTGAEIGKVIRMGGLLKPELDLEHGGRRIGSVKVADRRQRVVDVYDEAGTEIAKILTITEDTALPVPDRTDGYYLTTHHPLAEPLRSLVVGCAIVLQSFISIESATASFSITSPGIPALLDRLKRRPRS